MIDPLTLDQMRVLVAVAEAGSFSAAARRLGRVQSAISQAVQAMETTLGMALFDRSTQNADPDRRRRGDPGGRARDRAQRDSACSARAREHRRRRRAGTDPRGRRDLSDAAVDAEPRGAARRVPALPATVFTESLGGAQRDACSAAPRGWRSTPARRADAGPRRRIPDDDRARSRRRRRPSAGARARADPRARRWSRMCSSC